ncbi:MAG: site-specific integrase, partial [Micrococcales bacterium]|nr:site-specific integrase [Micrococcales bacterium]
MDVESAISQCLAHLGVERGLSRNTLLAYARDLRRYGGYLGGQGVVDIGAVSEGDVRGFAGWLRGGGVLSGPGGAG